MKRLRVLLLCLFLMLPGCRAAGRVAADVGRVAVGAAIIVGFAALATVGGDDCEGCR